jgi:hypothetical protein
MRFVFLVQGTISSFHHFIKLTRSVATGHHVAPITDFVRGEHPGSISEICCNVTATLITPQMECLLRDASNYSILVCIMFPLLSSCFLASLVCVSCCLQNDTSLLLFVVLPLLEISLLEQQHCHWSLHFV